MTEPRPRIAVISDFTLDTLGGAEAAYAEQVRCLGSRYEVVALCPRGDRLAALEQSPGVTVVGLPILFRMPGLGLPVAPNTRALRAMLRQVLTTHRIQVIHLHSEFGVAAAVQDVAEELGLPVVQTVHCWLQTHWPVQGLLAAGVPPFHRWLTGQRSPQRTLASARGDSAMRNMTLAVARRSDRVVSPSSHLAEDLRAAGLDRVDVIPNALADLPPADPLTAVDGPLRVFWFGRCVGEKRLLPFVRSAVDAVRQLGPGRLHVEIAGDGEHLARAKHLAADCPDVHFLGRISRPEVARRLRASHLSALTSVGFDNQPMVVVESLAATRGILFTDPRLREGLSSGAGLPAFGPEDVLTGRLVALAQDPAPVLAASRAAVVARTQFSQEHFLALAADCYRRAQTGRAQSTQTIQTTHTRTRRDRLGIRP